MRLFHTNLHIFRRTLFGLDLAGLSGSSFGSLARYFEYIGALVPPDGPLILFLSDRSMVCFAKRSSWFVRAIAIACALQKIFGHPQRCRLVGF